MYPTPIEVVRKPEEAFKRERHLPENASGQSAAVNSQTPPVAPRVPKENAAPLADLFHLKKSLEFSTEELLLVGLILWQVFCREHDWLLISVLLFLLLFD